MSEQQKHNGGPIRSTPQRYGGVPMPVDLLHTAQLTLLGELAAGLAHEIKNPLAGIKGSVDILLLRNGLDDEQRAVLEGVLAQVARIDATVTSLLAHATPHPHAAETIVLADLIEAAVSLAKDAVLRPACRLGKRLELVYDYPSEPIVVHADPTLIENAVLNLVKNAAEAIDETGTITVGIGYVEGQTDVAFVEVSDTGKGLDDEELRQAFHRFYTTKPWGTGLGLPAVQRIARSHGGRVSVTTRPGHGATFRIELPARAVPLAGA